MKRPDGRIEKGQKIASAISARAWNRAQDAADVVLGVRPNATAGDATFTDRAVNYVLVRNDTGLPVPMLGVVMIGSPVISPAGGTITGQDAASARAREFVRRPVMIGDKPGPIGIGSAERCFGIAMQPIAVGLVGRVAVSGVMPCKVEILDTSHAFATMRDGDVTQLQTAACGPMQLLWKETATAPSMNRWALGVM